MINASWITPSRPFAGVAPLFSKQFTPKKPLRAAALSITAAGTYEARLNGQRISECVLAPGWTAYEKRHPYQTYDILPLITEGLQTLSVLVAEGWERGAICAGPTHDTNRHRTLLPPAIIAQLLLTYEDGEEESIPTDTSWQVSESPLRFCSIYDGATYDASCTDFPLLDVVTTDLYAHHPLIPQDGEDILEQEHIKPARLIVTPKGETVLDFGQNLTGYVTFSLTAHKGDKVELSHAEILDKDGNFYTENYRTAKAKLDYTCCEGFQTYKCTLTFYGFRYIRLDAFPGEVHPEDFTAIVVHSDMKRTGRLVSGHALLNRLFDNIIWGQKGNFVDVPTDCPQRDERLGWTGDAQVFVRTASYNFNVLRFFKKWLRDVAAEQLEDGKVTAVVPTVFDVDCNASAAWGDVACVAPWQMYLTYGDKEVLREQLKSMKMWISYISTHTTKENLWTGGEHFGDWVGLDAFDGSYKGASREDLIATAYYYYSTTLVAKTCAVLGEDGSAYAALAGRIRDAFQKEFPTYTTQTECTVAVYFDLAADKQAVGDQLAKMVHDNGDKLTTGFVGTPYLLHALSQTGHAELAYSLLLQEAFPSWLFSVKQGATTIWEHWDGMNDKGELWSSDMNSFNHYAYGAVADWVYGVAAGIQTVEEKPGFAAVRICPVPDKRLGMLQATLDTAYGTISSKWEYTDGLCRYEISTPVAAEIHIAGKHYTVAPGTYLYYSE